MSDDKVVPAFPHNLDSLQFGTAGMTLRDWFAGQALAGLCANATFDDTFCGDGSGHAGFAYRCADAMMEARK